MKKSARILAVLAAAATLGLGLSSCDYWDTEWYKSGGDKASASSGSGSGSDSGSSGSTASSGSAAYAGNLTVNSVAYTTLTMTGDASSGTAVLSGNGGSANGTYARSAVAAAANTLNLSGTYTLTFSFGTITVVFANNTVTVSAGSVSASGTASVSTESSTAAGSGSSSGSAGSGTTTTTASTTPAITTLNGLTFVNSANSSEKIVGTSDSALEWHNPSFIAQITSSGGTLPTTYDSSTGVMTCSYSLKQVTDKLFDYIEFTNPWFEVNYGMCGVGFAITNATTLNANDGRDLGTFVRQ